MSDTLKETTYEILARFTCEVGERFGEMRAVSLAKKAYMVDDSGIIKARLDRGRDDFPVDTPVESIQLVLGEQFSTFAAQLSAAQAERDQVKQQAQIALDTAEKKLAEVTAERDALAQKIAAASAQLAAA